MENMKKASHKAKVHAMKKKAESQTRAANAKRKTEMTKLEEKRTAAESQLQNELNKKKNAIKKMHDARDKQKKLVEKLVKIEKKKRASHLVKQSKCPSAVSGYAGLNKKPNADVKPTKATKCDKKTVKKLVKEVLEKSKKTGSDSDKIAKIARELANDNNVQTQAVALGMAKVVEMRTGGKSDLELQAQLDKYLATHLIIASTKANASIPLVGEGNRKANITCPTCSKKKGSGGISPSKDFAVDPMAGSQEESFSEKHGCGRDLRDLK